MAEAVLAGVVLGSCACGQLSTKAIKPMRACECCLTTRLGKISSTYIHRVSFRLTETSEQLPGLLRCLCSQTAMRSSFFLPYLRRGRMEASRACGHAAA